MGTTAQRIVQIGRESTWGTNVAAGGILSGVTDVTWMQNTMRMKRKYLTGTFSPGQKAITVGSSASCSITQDFTPEDAVYILDAGFQQAVITGAGPYLYTHTAPTTTQTLRSRTIEWSDQQQAYEMGGGIVKGFSISAGSDDVWQLKSDWIGKAITASTLTGALSVRTSTPLPSAKTLLWIDDLGGTIGTTAVTATLIDWEFTYDSGAHLKQFQDGALTPSAYGKSDQTAKLTLTYEANASGVAELGKYLASTDRLIRLQCTSGAAIGQIDFAGIYDPMADAWGDRDGNTTLTMTINAIEDAGAFASWLKILTTSSVATLVAAM